ncbi:SDR family oxidoreductase [Mycobacterium sp. RTGN5]|uniref:SDR family oxidoreductase n=1 Tax=Mycobacterium sp. RTGN5 TaxID=3016522 RepID=UPI0029C87BCF|nr:SDR family oxidoreductase [Mycobacterium sp. RTGN5]
MADQPLLAGMRTLVVGASSGIGHAFAIAASAHGAHVTVAARRMDLLTELAAQLGGSAVELDVSDPHAIQAVVSETARQLGGIDAIVFTSAVVPFVRVEHITVATWTQTFAVNTIGPALVMAAALPYLSDEAVILIASSHDVGRPRAGVAAHSASKAALDEILRSWRCEHPDLPVIRVGIGPTVDTEILRGADRDLLAELYEEWDRSGQVPAEMSTAADVANTMVSLIAAARTSPTVVAESVRLATRVTKK